MPSGTIIERFPMGIVLREDRDPTGRVYFVTITGDNHSETLLREFRIHREARVYAQGAARGMMIGAARSSALSDVRGVESVSQAVRIEKLERHVQSLSAAFINDPEDCEQNRRLDNLETDVTALLKTVIYEAQKGAQARDTFLRHVHEPGVVATSKPRIDIPQPRRSHRALRPITIADFGA